MNEKKYQVCDGYDQNSVLASNMTFEMAICFVEGYRSKYFNEPLSLLIEEMPRCSERKDGTK